MVTLFPAPGAQVFLFAILPSGSSPAVFLLPESSRVNNPR